MIMDEDGHMPMLKSARHHWWPRCVSARWAANDGKTGWVRPNGFCIHLPPKELGQIGNAHSVKFSRDPGGSTPWDMTFEEEFDAADRHFPKVISWLESLDHKFMPHAAMRDRFREQASTDDQLRLLTECVVSLAVRSPRNREASVAPAEDFRGPLSTPERKALIGANMRRSQRVIADTIGAKGKYAVLFSSGKEFIFGDGFFHNVTAVVNPPLDPKMLVPITPTLSVIITRPLSFGVQPRLSTIVLTDAEVQACNDAVQVYARQALYFRSEQPIVVDDFACAEHRAYAHPDNPIDTLIRSIPGIPPRDASLDSLCQWVGDRPAGTEK